LFFTIPQGLEPCVCPVRLVACGAAAELLRAAPQNKTLRPPLVSAVVSFCAMAVGKGMDLAQEHASATAVQAQFKGHCARKERDQKIASATAVQAAYRAHDARSQVARGEWKQRYCAPAEVSRHDRAEDLWVSVFGKVGASLRNWTRAPVVSADARGQYCSHADPAGACRFST
jgi:hypothetical protein